MSPVHEASPPSVPTEPGWRISYAEIASLAQVRRPVPTTWARRHDDFPGAVTHEGGRPMFDGRAIVDWLLVTGHGNADPRHLQAELALHAFNAWSERLPGRSLLEILTALICLRHQDEQPLGGDWSALAERARYIDEDDTFLRREIETAVGIAPRLAGLTGLADQLVEAAYSPAEAFSWVLDARRRLGSHDLAIDAVTPAMAHCIARLTGIADLEDGSVVASPDARAGDLLAALHEQAQPESGHTYLAGDPDPAFARLLRRRMLVRDVMEFNLDVNDGDELAIDDFGNPAVIVAAIPYMASEARQALATLERVEVLTDLLTDHCTAVVLGPADALTGSLPAHGAADRLRRALLTSGLLKVVVNLSGGVMPYRPAYRTALWILSRTPETERHGRVLVADLAGQELTEESLAALAEDVHIWRAGGWADDGRHDPRHGVIYPVRVLAERPGVAFMPQHRPHTSRFTRTVLDRPAQISELEVRLEELTETARRELDVRVGLRAHASLRASETPVRRTTIGRLLKERRLRKLPGHRIAAEHLHPDGHYVVVTPAEVTGAAPIGTHRIARAVLFTAYEHAEFTEPGDVVVTTSPSFGAYVDEAGLSVVAYPARVLRVRPDAERPVHARVLASLFRTAATQHSRTTGAVRAARRIEDIEIPDLDGDEAARHDALLAEIARRTELLREQVAAMEALSNLTAAGLIDGTLTLQPAPLQLQDPPTNEADGDANAP